MGFLTGKILNYLFGALALAAVGVAVANWWQLDKAHSKIAQVEGERDVAKASLEKALGVNAENQLTIGQLQQEKLDTQRSLNALESDKKRNQQVINNLADLIKSGKDLPENKVELSPVLKLTVDNIQKQRAAREGAPQ